MTSTMLNRPLAHYVIVQASLVLLAAASAHPVNGLVQSAGMTISPLLVALILALLTQLPVAMMYARSEMRNLTSGEGWLLASTFVGFTVLSQSSLQMLLAQAWPIVARQQGLGPQAAQDALVFGVCATLLVFLAVSFVVSALFRLSVRKNLLGQRRSRMRRFGRPRRVFRARLLRRAVCVLSAGLAGIGIAWGLAFGWTLAHTHATAVLSLGILYTSLPRVTPGGAVRWTEVWSSTLPAMLSAVMTFSITASATRVLVGGGRVIDMLAPAMGTADAAAVGSATAQVSGALLMLLCVNVVVVWSFAAIVGPVLQARQTPRPVATPVLPPKTGDFADHPGLAGTKLPREDAIELIRAAREMLLEQQQAAQRRTPRPVM